MAVEAGTTHNNVLLPNRTGQLWAARTAEGSAVHIAPWSVLFLDLQPGTQLEFSLVAPLPDDTPLFATPTRSTWAIEIFEEKALGVLFGLRLHEWEKPILSLRELQRPNAEQVSIEMLDVSARTENTLKRRGILTVNQLLSTPLENLFEDRAFGPENYVEIAERVLRL